MTPESIVPPAAKIKWGPDRQRRLIFFFLSRPSRLFLFESQQQLFLDFRLHLSAESCYTTLPIHTTTLDPRTVRRLPQSTFELALFKTALMKGRISIFTSQVRPHSVPDCRLVSSLLLSRPHHHSLSWSPMSKPPCRLRLAGFAWFPVFFLPWSH
ncbi:hypothetical protein VTJ49DRAFT_4519 [Mycothermus thermophilus]|uniref:Uncharacterized protein n=1 Tax=Humicola insolens TaxID=85995 RepID=A0ABR3V564_HUMIN